MLLVEGLAVGSDTRVWGVAFTWCLTSRTAALPPVTFSLVEPFGGWHINSRVWALSEALAGWALPVVRPSRQGLFPSGSRHRRRTEAVTLI